jgi:hypothetical protein
MLHGNWFKVNRKAVKGRQTYRHTPIFSYIITALKYTINRVQENQNRLPSMLMVLIYMVQTKTCGVMETNVKSLTVTFKGKEE